MSKLQKASRQRAWRILRMKGVLTFMQEMKLNEDLQTAVEEHFKHMIEQRFHAELK